MLAIGIVVDDAIVMLENIVRRIELGDTPLVAAYKGAKQVSFAIIATTVVLVAVFVPLILLKALQVYCLHRQQLHSLRCNHFKFCCSLTKSNAC